MPAAGIETADRIASSAHPRDARDRTKRRQCAAGIAVGNQVPGIAENLLVVSADFTSGNFYGGLSTKYVDDRFVNLSNTWTADGYVDADLYLGVSGSAISEDFSNLDLRPTVNNLLDENFLGGISGNAAWISAPRTVALTVTADF